MKHERRDHEYEHEQRDKKENRDTRDRLVVSMRDEHQRCHRDTRYGCHLQNATQELFSSLVLQGDGERRRKPRIARRRPFQQSTAVPAAGRPMRQIRPRRRRLAHRTAQHEIGEYDDGDEDREYRHESGDRVRPAHCRIQEDGEEDDGVQHKSRLNGPPSPRERADDVLLVHGQMQDHDLTRRSRRHPLPPERERVLRAYFAATYVGALVIWSMTEPYAVTWPLPVVTRTLTRAL